uniref:RPA43 OB domain-containing protein n=1 Tax=Rhodotorula toruloides TaxID=5286 RepID=A0A0K3CR30_RHOTO
MAAATAAASLRLASVGSDPSSSSEFVSFKATMRLPIAPVFAGKGDNMFPGHDGGMDGVREVLAGWVMRYLPPIRAVLLSFSPTPRFVHPAASFPAALCPFDNLQSVSMKDPRSLLSSPQPGAANGDEDDEEQEVVRLKTLPMVDGSGFTLANVEWEGVGWRPRVGMKVVGTLTLATPSHVSLLLHNLFNASIPSSHIPTSTYEYDPECPVPAVVLERRTATVPFATNVAKGWWVHRKSREPLGGADGRLEFTLVDLTNTNSLLSCTGSLLADPFSPSAVAAIRSSISTASAPTASSTLLKKGKKRARDSDEESDSDAEEESEFDGDDDDRVGTGIPRPGRATAAGQGIARRNEDSSASEDEDEDEDDRESIMKLTSLLIPVDERCSTFAHQGPSDRSRRRRLSYFDPPAFNDRTPAPPRPPRAPSRPSSLSPTSPTFAQHRSASKAWSSVSPAPSPSRAETPTRPARQPRRSVSIERDRTVAALEGQPARVSGESPRTASGARNVGREYTPPPSPPASEEVPVQVVVE